MYTSHSTPFVAEVGWVYLFWSRVAVVLLPSVGKGSTAHAKTRLAATVHLVTLAESYLLFINEEYHRSSTVNMLHNCLLVLVYLWTSLGFAGFSRQAVPFSILKQLFSALACSLLDIGRHRTATLILVTAVSSSFSAALLPAEFRRSTAIAHSLQN